MAQSFSISYICVCVYIYVCVYVYTHIFFQILFHYRFLQNIEYRSLCYILGPFFVFYICSSVYLIPYF